MSVATGLEILQKGKTNRLKNKNVGIVAHPASVTSNLHHACDVINGLGANVVALFGPEHGFGGEAQDMESVGARANASGASVPAVPRIFSLYGKDEASLSPSDAAVADLDCLVVDLADVGSRYYTFVWTAVLCLRVCHRAQTPMLLLDRPNPLGGLAVEGGLQDDGFLSFVGLCPVPNRHGLTVGEIVKMVAQREGICDALEVVPMEGWERALFFDQTGLPWVFPSPNMPTLDTAIVYPGGCLLEATTLSEGRGTTRPFEVFGAPGIDGNRLASALNALHMPGCWFRPIQFKPMFQKHAGVICGGAQLHVTDRQVFFSYRTGIAILHTIYHLFPDVFGWRPDPYEFISDIPAIDLLTGNDTVRTGLEQGAALQDLFAGWRKSEVAWTAQASANYLY